MAPIDRDKSFRVRVSEDELRMVQELADAEGLNASDFVRLYIRRAHAEKFGARGAPRKGRRS
jgi:predicted DNA binding CopG/RHH family protein